jgi:hypothetical protein
VPESLSARILVDLYPTTTVGPTGLSQGKGGVAKWTPAARIQKTMIWQIQSD